VVAALVAVTGLDGWFIVINAAATAILGHAVQSSEPVAKLSQAMA
jgi:hypothetical protein